MSPEEALTLFEYNGWANARSLDSVLPLSSEQFLQPLGSSFTSLRDTLAHIYGAEYIWLERFLGSTHVTFPDHLQFVDLGTLRKTWDEFGRRLMHFVRGLDQPALDRVHHFKTLKSGEFHHSLAHALQHLANHGTYHRGQVATMLRQIGAVPVGTDFIRFIRERPQAVPS